jgi:hypothetical protein
LQRLLDTLGNGMKTNKAIAHIYGLSINELENKTMDYIKRVNK